MQDSVITLKIFDFDGFYDNKYTGLKLDINTVIKVIQHIHSSYPQVIF